MRYSELTRRYFESATRAGTLPNAFRGTAGNQQTGIWVQFDVQVSATVIVEARFLAFGCPHTIAVAAWLAESCVGVRLSRDLPESAAVIRERFAMPVEKFGRLLIVEDAWKAALGAAIDSATRAHTSTLGHEH